ncbi:MAG TPA: hypothetical protein VES79_00030 [Solirubrobacteraceae bacterium]|nr:hypothetical protein [Solirubrobacteraceae bacterium]
MTTSNASRSSGTAPIIEITWEQRDVLRKELSSDVHAVLDDLATSAERGRGGGEDEWNMRLRADVGMWLLDDLGWDLVDSRETYYLTVPRDRFASWLRWIRAGVEWCLSDTAKDLSNPEQAWGWYVREGHMTVAEFDVEIVESREMCDRDLDVLRVCDELLAELETSV